MVIPKLKVIGEDFLPYQPEHIDPNFESQRHLISEVKAILIWVKSQPFVILFKLVRGLNPISINSKVIFRLLPQLLLLLLLLFPLIDLIGPIGLLLILATGLSRFSAPFVLGALV